MAPPDCGADYTGSDTEADARALGLSLLGRCHGAGSHGEATRAKAAILDLIDMG